jgi:hypothetical protein
MNQPLDLTGKTYFVAGLYREGRRIPVMVWNGIKDYANDVPHELVGLVASQSTGTIGTWRRVSAGSYCGARDQKTYSSIVKELRTYAVANMDSV